jgi:2-keto-4-pentenoate hydratase/2-oxohepta-3-ene-1,7-dioic acid hydratase in catechol pathway
MKIVRFLWGDVALYGIVEGDIVYSLCGDIFGKFSRGTQRCRLADVKILAPVQPSIVVGTALNYRKEGRAKTDGPLFFTKPPMSVIGPGDSIVLPSMSQQAGGGPELAVIIGRRAKNVSESEALDYVFGYTCTLDVEAADLYKKDDHRPRGKSFDTFCPIGPYIITDIKDPNNLAIESRVNGEVRAKGRTSELHYNVQQVLSEFSKITTLRPGDIIQLGEPPGGGSFKPGDTVEVEVEGIGILQNKVVAE